MPNSAAIRLTFTMIEAGLSFVGAGIAGTLWWAERTDRDLPCSADGGCETVAASAWSHIDLILWHHVPLSLLGLSGYLFLLVLAMMRLGMESEHLNHRLLGLFWLAGAGGTLSSWYLQWIAYAQIGAFCLWCCASAIVMTALFLAATIEWGWKQFPAGSRNSS